jgi:tetratricopeptide (TPR) repeat protein
VQIREIRNAQYFQDFCQQILAAEYEDFQALDDSHGDSGSDGYVPSKRRLFAIYCPESHPTPERYYKDKIRSDFGKAVKLRDELGYEIDDWMFLTPAPLPEALHRFISEKAKEAGFNRGISWSEKNILPLLLKHPHLKPLYPELFIVDLQGDVHAGFADMRALQAEDIEVARETRAGVATVITKLEVADDLQQKFTDRVSAEYERRFKEGKEHFDCGRFIRAKEVYEQVLRDLKLDEGNPDRSFFYRACTNIALCEWHLRDSPSAARWFEEAHTYKPEDKKSIANLATAQMLRRQYTAALETVERALEIDPDDEDSITVKANILSVSGRPEEAVAFLEERGKVKLASFFRANLLSSEGRYEEASDVFRDLLRDDPEDVDYMDHFAADVIHAHQRVLLRDWVFPWKMPARIRETFAEAEQVLTRAVELLKNREEPRKLYGVYTNRAVTRLMLGRDRGALQDCKEAIKIDPTEPVAFLNKSKVEASLDDFPAAIESLEEYARLSGGISDRARDLVYFYYMAGRIDKAAELVASAFSEDFSENDLPYVGLAVSIHDFNQDFEAADKLVERIAGRFPNNPQALITRARHLQHTGRPGAGDLLRKALEVADERQADFARFELANYLYQSGNFLEALTHYEVLLEGSEITRLHYRYLYCLFTAGRYSECLRVAAQLRDNKIAEFDAQVIEAAVYKELGQLREAAALSLSLYQRAPDRIDCLVEYGICSFRLDERERALKAFDQARNRITKTKDFIALADGYAALAQYRTAVELSYRALQQSPHDPRAHFAYFRCCIAAEQAGEVLEEKYIKAAQDVSAHFAERFPGDNSLATIDLGRDFSGLSEMLDRSRASFEQLMDLYKRGALSIYSVATRSGRDLFTVWTGLSATDNLGIRIAVGDDEEQRGEGEEAAQSRQAVADLLALFTLQRVGQLHLLKKVFDRVLVHQAVLDELISIALEEGRVAQTGRTTLVKSGDTLATLETSPEEVRRNIEFLNGIKEFVKAECEVKGLREELSSEDRDLFTLFSPSAVYSAGLAQQEQAALLSDDAVLRKWARIDRGRVGFSSELLFKRAVERKALSKTRAHDLRLLLLRCNYHYLSIDAECLLHAAEKSGYRSGRDFDLALREIAHANTTTESLAGVIAGFMLVVWGRPIPLLLKWFVLRRILKAITNTHNPAEILRALLNHLFLLNGGDGGNYGVILSHIKEWSNERYPGLSLTNGARGSDAEQADMRAPVAHSEILGSAPTDEQLKAVVGSFRKEPAFFMLAFLNLMLSLFDKDAEKGPYLQGFLIHNLVREELRKKVLGAAALYSERPRPVFNRWHLLALMKLVLLESTVEGEYDPRDDKEARYRIGDACLMLSDLLFSEEQLARLEDKGGAEERERVHDEFTAQLLFPFELANRPDMFQAIARYDEYVGIFERRYAQLKFSGGQNLAQQFSALTGLDLRQYLQLYLGVYAVLSDLINLHPNDLNENPGKVNFGKDKIFSLLRVSPQERDAFFARIVKTPAELAEGVKADDAAGRMWQFDFTTFRDSPLVYIASAAPGFTCLDFSFLVDKLTSGMYHTVFNSWQKGDSDRDVFQSHWGKVFEIYVNDRLGEEFSKDKDEGVFYVNPEFHRKQSGSVMEVSDGVLTSGNALVLMEHKGGYLSLDEKYSGDAGKLLTGLANKFGLDKAVKQLSRGISRLFDEDAEKRDVFSVFNEAHRPVRTFGSDDAAQIRKVYPVLVVQDFSMTIGFMNRRLKLQFAEKMQEYSIDPRVEVRPLSLLSVEDLEDILEHREEVSLTEILDEYARDQHEPLSTFNGIFGRYLREKGIKRRRYNWSVKRVVETIEAVKRQFGGSQESLTGTC